LEYTKAELRFQAINLYSIIALFIVILAGGVVRSTGSGMGCPDWPKCFGKYIPPVKEAQLPQGYRTQYVEKQLKKNKRFAKVLESFGYITLAKKIKNDTSIENKKQEEFNPFKTWTEYINRLIGVIAGVLLLATTFLSLQYFKKSKLIVFLSLFNLLLIFFQAWLGSIVVSSNLVPWIVTIHMLIALAILAVSIFTWYKSKHLQQKTQLTYNPIITSITGFALLTDVIQITFGTEVREKIDEYATKFNGDNRQLWVNGAEQVLMNHKNLALVVILTNVILYMLLKKRFERSSIQRQLMSISFIIIMFQVFVGVLLAYWGLPPVAQATHILFASLLFGVQFLLLLNVFKTIEVSGEKYNVG